MRHIDTTKEKPPKAWLNKAKKLTEQLTAIDDINKKIAFIKKHQKVWKELEGFLKKLSHDKCWYSEAKDCASYWHVDHFRPKSEVKGLNGEKFEGYWWLAFEWRNYRLSGSAINTPKSSKFPVRTGTQRATNPANDINDEEPYLLDPTNTIDSGMLAFDEEGMPKSLCVEDGWNKERVDVSIEILNLKFDSLVQARKRVWFECNNKINEAVNLLGDINRDKSTTKNKKFGALIEDIKQMISETAPFSMAATACVESQGIPWLTRMVFQ
jgi:hypothetical protein